MLHERLESKRAEEIESAYQVEFGKKLNLKAKSTTMAHLFQYANQFCGLKPDKDSELYAVTRGEGGKPIKDSECVRLTNEMFEIDPTVADIQDWKPIRFETEKTVPNKEK